MDFVWWSYFIVVCMMFLMVLVCEIVEVKGWIVIELLEVNFVFEVMIMMFKG